MFLNAAIAAALLCAGCTQNPNQGLGNQDDIGITRAVLDAYTNKFLRSHDPEAFAVSESGRYYYYYFCTLCDSINNWDAHFAATQAISGCNQQGHGPCVLFALRRSEPRKYHLIN
jgi:hypothetical protein